MSITERAALIFINRKIKCILKAPRMWGDLESIELQVLLLLDMYCFIRSKAIHITQDYVRFLSNRFDKKFNCYLSGHLKHTFPEDMWNGDFCVDVLVHTLEDYSAFILLND